MRNEIWPGTGGGAGAAGCRDGSRVPLAARIAWQFDQLGNDQAPLSVTASVAAAAGIVVAPFQSAAGPGLVALPADNPGEVRPLWIHRTSAAVRDSPAIAGGRVFAVSCETGDAPCRLHALDLARGDELWSLPLQAADAALTAGEDCVFVQEAPGRLSCLDLDGRRRWTAQVGTLRQELDASTRILIAVTENPPALLAIDAPSGQSLWTCPLPCPATTPPAVRGKSICFADATGIQFRSLIDGRDLGRVEEDVSGPLYVGPGRYAFISRGGELVLGDPSGGRVVARVSGAVPATNPLVAFNAVLFCTPTGIQAVDLQGRGGRPYADLGPATITAPPVLYAGRVYLGLAGRGLVCLAGDEVP